jgi:hypothetical protein
VAGRIRLTEKYHDLQVLIKYFNGDRKRTDKGN